METTTFTPQIGDRVRHATYGIGHVVEPTQAGMLRIKWERYYDHELGDMLDTSEWDLLDGPAPALTRQS